MPQNFISVFSQFPNIHAGFIGMPLDGKKDNLLKVLPNGLWNDISQVHGDIISNASLFSQVSDGMFTREKNIGCKVLTADCIGAIFYDEKTKEIATVHAGWHGLAQKIFTKYCSKFQDYSEIHVALSPSLGVCCSEFSNPYEETPVFFHNFIIQKNRKYFVDLWEIAKNELLECGILEKNIIMPSLCTKCGNGFWSHRNQHQQRNVSFIIKH